MKKYTQEDFDNFEVDRGATRYALLGIILR